MGTPNYTAVLYYYTTINRLLFFNNNNFINSWCVLQSLPGMQSIIGTSRKPSGVGICIQTIKAVSWGICDVCYNVTCR